MKEDILEQLAEDYLQVKGYFTKNNVKFRPEPSHPDYIKNQDCVHSDIDVIGINPLLTGSEKVYAIGCKSWQKGFDVKYWTNIIKDNGKRSKREAWKYFRELVQPKWNEAFIKKIYDITGQDRFTYITAVTVLKGNKNVWEQNELFIRNMKENPIKIVTFSEMIGEVTACMNTYVESSQLGRTLQLIKASRFDFK